MANGFGRQVIDGALIDPQEVASAAHGLPNRRAMPGAVQRPA